MKGLLDQRRGMRRFDDTQKLIGGGLWIEVIHRMLVADSIDKNRGADGDIYAYDEEGGQVKECIQGRGVAQGDRLTSVGRTVRYDRALRIGQSAVGGDGERSAGSVMADEFQP